jgi:hypothetical protein
MDAEVFANLNVQDRRGVIMKKTKDLGLKYVTLKINGIRVRMASRKQREEKEKSRKLMRRLRKLKNAKIHKFDNPTMKMAMTREDWLEWERAIEQEYQQMVNDKVYVEVKKFPPKANVVGTMMVLNLKRLPDGSVDKGSACCAWKSAEGRILRRNKVRHGQSNFGKDRHGFKGEDRKLGNGIGRKRGLPQVKRQGGVRREYLSCAPE